MKIITDQKAFQSNDNFPLADSPYFGMEGGQGQGQGPIQDPPSPRVNRMTGRHDRNHYLPATDKAVGNTLTLLIPYDLVK